MPVLSTMSWRRLEVRLEICTSVPGTVSCPRVEHWVGAENVLLNKVTKKNAKDRVWVEPRPTRTQDEEFIEWSNNVSTHAHFELAF